MKIQKAYIAGSMIMKKGIFFIMLFVCMAAYIMWNQKVESSAAKPIVKTIEKPQQAQIVGKAPDIQKAFVQSFEYHPIDKVVEKRIKGISWKQNNTVKLSDLCYVKVTYWGFDEKPHIGELIVDKDLGQEVVEIFQELYDAKFPIEKIKLIDEYNAVDIKSMEDNNTSAFCYREVEGKPGKLSKHSYGIAIDINPLQNPYVYKKKISPAAGKAYVDRSNVSKGMIIKNDVCYKAFTSRGWTWGGNWKYEKDYQHFQK